MSLPALDLRDPAQAAALSERSLVISASAGSGKTFALVTVVLGHLGRGGRPGDVVATTFGREAASDLRSRILAPLDQLAAWPLATWDQALEALSAGFEAWDAWLDPESRPGRVSPGRVCPELGPAARQWLSKGNPAWMASSAKAREHWIRTRREGELLQATTVHALAQTILRRHGAGGDSLVEAEDPALVRLLRAAGREVLSLPETDPDAAAARRLWAWCEGYEEGKDRWSALAAAFDAHLDALGTWRTALDAAVPREGFLREGRRLLAAYAPFAENPALAANLTKQGKPHANFQKAGPAKLQPEPGPDAALPQVLETLERLALRFLKPGDGQVPTYYSEAFRDALRPLAEELPTHLETWMTMILERVFQRFRDLKTERGLRSYGDLVREAQALLADGPGATGPGATGPGAAGLGEASPGLLLVDEYQDINPVQEAFLDALNAQRTVLVGDPKQAIYGFRGGVPELLRARLQAAGLKGGGYRLPRNHRSSGPVVELANAFVGEVVPALDPASADPDGVQAQGDRGAGNPLVALANLPSSKKSGGDLPGCAPWVSALAREAGWTALGFPSQDPGPRRRALLLPRRTGLPALRRSLQAAGIEPLVQGREGFWESPGVRFLMALLEAVTDPEARTARLSVLRLWTPDPELLALDQPSARLKADLAWLDTLGHRTTQTLIAETLARPGLLELLSATSVHGSLEPARARRNLEHFLGWLPDLPAVPALAWAKLAQRRAFQDPGDAPAEDAAADLVIQTVHGAKGLEYDDVILPLLADPVKGLRKGTVRQRPGQAGPLWIGWKLGHARGQALQELRSEEARRIFREGLNLLYVALTRARDRMFLLQQWPRDKEGIPQAPPSAAERLAEGKGIRWHHLGTDLGKALPNLPRRDEPPPPFPTLRPSPSPELEHSARLPLPSLTAPPARDGVDERVRKGIQIHALLREVLVRASADPKAARTYLADHPLLRTWPEAEGLVQGVLEELAARGWAGLPRRTEFELQEAGKAGGAGRADLVLWEPDRRAPSRVLLVDFKLAARFSPETLDLHRLQLAAYREALIRQTGCPHVEAWVVGLEGGGWVRLA